MSKREIRSRFRMSVFTRDRFACRTCGSGEHLAAHHITDRHEIPNGGYVKENGIALCPRCHIKAEVFHNTVGADWITGFHPTDLYALIESSRDLAFAKASKLA